MAWYVSRAIQKRKRVRVRRGVVACAGFKHCTAARAPGSSCRSSSVARSERDLHQRPGKRLIGFAINLDIFGLARQPMFRDTRGFCAFVPRDDLDQSGVVGFAHSVGDGGDVVPLEKRADDGVIAMKKNEIGKNALLLVAVRLLQMFDVVRASAFVQLFVPIGIAPAQVGSHRLAREVVRENAVHAGLDERQTAQPLEQFVRVRDAEHLGKERLGGQANQGARFEHRRGAPVRVLFARIVLRAP